MGYCRHTIIRKPSNRMSWLRGARISIFVSMLAFVFEMAWLTESAEARQDLVPGSRYVPARAAAMGDAYLPLADDPASGLFYNPAGLGLLRGFRADIFNLQLYGNTNYFGQMDLQHLDFYKVTSLSSYLPTLQRSPNQYTSVGAAFAPAFYFKGIAFGVLVQNQIAGEYIAETDSVNYRSTYQLIPAVGGALRLAEGIVRVGYSLQWVNQASGSVSGIPADSLSLGYNQSLYKGSALSHNVGFALTLPYRYLPQFNIVGRNLFTARFKGSAIMPFSSGGNGPPPDEPATFDASISMINKIGGGADFTWVFVDRDFTRRSGVTLLGRMAIGLEFSFRDSFFLRGGWGSGYPNAGLGLRRRRSEFSLSWTSEEVGNHYHDKRDTRFMMQYQVRAF